MKNLTRREAIGAIVAGSVVDFHIKWTDIFSLIGTEREMVKILGFSNG